MQCKLGEVADIVAGGDVNKFKLLKFGKYPVIANALTNDGIVGYYENEYRVKAPAVTVTGRGDVGNAQARKINFTPIVRLLAIKSDFDVDFLANAINRFDIFVESTGVPQLTSPQLANYEIIYPTVEEQTYIGMFFYILDNIIAKQKRQLERLKELKKAYLQQMFPRAGETVPRVRFAGFTEPWKLRTLGEVIIKNSEKNKDMFIDNVESVSNKYGFVKQDEYFEDRQIASKDTSNYYVIRRGAFAYNPSRINVGSIAVKEIDEISVVSPLYISFFVDNDLSRLFLWNWFMTSEFERGRQFSTAGGVRDTLSYDALQQIVITLPVLDEQIAIGEFVSNIDTQITAQTEKLEKLKQLKTAYLQKMFV